MTGEEKAEQLQRDYKAVFGTEAGKRVLEDLKRWCHVLWPSFTGDPYETVFNEGKRAVYLHIQSMLELDVEELRKLAKEGYYE